MLLLPSCYAPVAACASSAQCCSISPALLTLLAGEPKQRLPAASGNSRGMGSSIPSRQVQTRASLHFAAVASRKRQRRRKAGNGSRDGSSDEEDGFWFNGGDCGGFKGPPGGSGGGSSGWGSGSSGRGGSSSSGWDRSWEDGGYRRQHMFLSRACYEHGWLVQLLCALSLMQAVRFMLGHDTSSGGYCAAAAAAAAAPDSMAVAAAGEPLPC